MVTSLILGLWCTQMAWTGDGALIATLVDGIEPICKYDQSTINRLCGSLVFCKMFHNKKSIFCKCEELVGPNQFAALYNEPLSTEECYPLRTSFCLPPGIEEGVNSSEGCFSISLTQVKIENKTRILQITQFHVLSVMNPKMVIMEFVFQSKISQVLNEPIENVQVRINPRHTHAYEQTLKFAALCLIMIAVLKIMYNSLSE